MFQYIYNIYSNVCCCFSLSLPLFWLQAKIHYLDIISGLPSYGAKCFSTNQRDGVERVLLISPRFGLSQIAGVRNSVVSVRFYICCVSVCPIDNVFYIIWPSTMYMFGIVASFVSYIFTLWHCLCKFCMKCAGKQLKGTKIPMTSTTMMPNGLWVGHHRAQHSSKAHKQNDPVQFGFIILTTKLCLMNLVMMQMQYSCEMQFELSRQWIW